MSTTTFPRRAWPAGDRTPGRVRSLVRGRAEDPSWARPALIGLLAATAIAYVWNLTASGDANSFYAAAVQAGTKSWKAFFFGSIDSSNFITVDKPPASLWVMALSGRIFGFSSASMLVPQVLEGVARRRSADRVGQALVRRGRRAACRRGARGHAGRGADVPLQQPGRTARVSAGRGGVLSGAGARARFVALADRRRDADRLRLPGEDDAGVPRRARFRARLPGRRAYDGASADRAAACRRRRDDRERGLVGRDRRARGPHRRGR